MIHREVHPSAGSRGRRAAANPLSVFLQNSHVQRFFILIRGPELRRIAPRHAPLVPERCGEVRERIAVTGAEERNTATISFGAIR